MVALALYLTIFNYSQCRISAVWENIGINLQDIASGCWTFSCSKFKIGYKCTKTEQSNNSLLVQQNDAKFNYLIDRFSARLWHSVQDAWYFLATISKNVNQNSLIKQSERPPITNLIPNPCIQTCFTKCTSPNGPRIGPKSCKWLEVKILSQCHLTWNKAFCQKINTTSFNSNYFTWSDWDLPVKNISYSNS